MNEKDTSEAIVYLPNKVNSLDNKSIYILLKETGYFEKFNTVTEGDIYDALNQHPSLVNEWIAWSENKQTSSGWYFTREEKGQYTVGFFPAQRGYKSFEFSENSFVTSFA